MEAFKVRRCLECGEGRIRPVTKQGRTMPYRTMLALEIPTEVPIPTCDHCGSEWIDEQTAAALDEVLEQQYRTELQARLKLALQQIETYAQISGRKLERLLGLSEGYLSHVDNERGNPSAQLVSALALVAEDPKHRLSELERLWSVDYRARLCQNTHA